MAYMTRFAVPCIDEQMRTNEKRHHKNSGHGPQERKGIMEQCGYYRGHGHLVGTKAVVKECCGGPHLRRYGEALW